MTAFIEMCNHNTKKSASNTEPKSYENMGTDELYKLMEHNKNHLSFMKDTGILEDEEKMSIVTNIRNINHAISVRTGLLGSINTNNDVS